MTDVATITLRASPDGSTAGFTVLSDGSETGAVAVVVLPKPWASAPGLVRSVSHQSGTTTHIVLYELDIAEIATERSAAQAIAFSVTSLPAESDDDDADQGRRLLEAIRASSTATSEAAPDDLHQALLRLLFIIERSRALRGRQSMQGRYSRSLVRLLEQLRLVDEVERVIYLARPRYEERHEELTIPRGRIVERALLRSEWSGVPRVESVFDELTTNTPVLQIAAAALRVTLADQHGSQLRAIAKGLRDRAARLLQLLSDVTVLDPSSALVLTERSQFGRLDQQWKPAIAAASPVLRGHGVVPQGGRDESQRTVVLSLPMEQAWEEWLERAMRILWTDVQPQARTRAPWAIDSHRPPRTGRIDFLARLANGSVAAIDAKYKIDRGYIRSGDGYQLFAYSHLARMDEDAPSLAVLLFPESADISTGRDVARQYWRVPGEPSFPLWTAKLPFPSPLELRGAEAFSDYLARLAAALNVVSAEWMTPTASSEALAMDFESSP